MKTYLLTGTYMQHFSVIVHSDGDEDEITEEGYAAFKRGDYLPGTIDDVYMDEIEQLEGNTDPED